MLTVNACIGEAGSELLNRIEGAGRIHELPLNAVVINRSGDKPGCAAGAAGFIGRILCNGDTGICKSSGTEREGQNKDKDNRDDLFHFGLSPFTRL